MTVYLKDIPLCEAKALFQGALEQAGLWKVLGHVKIPLNENSIGRVLAKPIWARMSSPHYHASAMDGFALRAIVTFGAQPSNPIIIQVGMVKKKCERNKAYYVDTGDPLPEGCDAVIPIENVEALDKQGNITSAIRRPMSIRIRAGVTPWSHVRPMGEDIVATQLILTAGHILQPVDLGAIAAAGYRSIDVAKRPRVAILPTGSELVKIGSVLKPGDILEYNSLVLSAQIKEWGGRSTRFPITPDNYEAIKSRVLNSLGNHDLILLNAGSSAGSEDFSASIVGKLGTLLVHGVAVRPGHPVILGLLNKPQSTQATQTKNKNGAIHSDSRAWVVPIIGVPGYPVSAALTAEIFIEPLIAKWTGRRPLERPVEQAYLTRKTTSPGGDDDYIRVAVGRVDGKLMATPLSRGAGVITSLVRADGLAILPRGVQGVEAGDIVNVSLYRTKFELEGTILCIGSHDVTIDLLAQFLMEKDRRLVSANVGSLAGLVALKRGEAHVAGSHLLDTRSGEYNITYIRKYLSDVPIKLYGFVEREQGLIIKRGNPKQVHNLEDLGRSKIRFINRQRGAGTRVLLDYMLSKKGIATDSIQGYNQEEYTHLGVAAAVASDRADCGLGIAAAAFALDLEFIPICKENYQLVIPSKIATGDLITPLVDILHDVKFRAAVQALPGYSVEMMGKLIAEV